MFLHAENKQILSSLLQKTPYYIEFVQLHPEHRTHWFPHILEQFYGAWIERGLRVPHSVQELLEMNKQALQYMIADIKQMSVPAVIQPYEIQNATSLFPTYNVALEKKQREDQWSSDFNKYQSEYNSLLATPAIPTGGIPYENPDGKIHNMDELMMEQRKRRDMDLALFTPPQPQLPVMHKPSLPPSSSGGGPPRLKIMDTIEQAEIEQSILAVREREEKKAKMVSWSDEELTNTYEEPSLSI